MNVLLVKYGVKLASLNLEGLVNLSLRVLKTVSQTTNAKIEACTLLTNLAEILKPVAEIVVPNYSVIFTFLNILFHRKK